MAKANGYSNGDMFNCTWRANNVSMTSSGEMRLALTSPSYNKFDCGENRSVQTYGYGLYEVRMKPAKTQGSFHRSSLIQVQRMALLGMRLISNF